MKNMTIGKLADSIGINIETIRFYQREGIIRIPLKKDNGFRYYSDQDVIRLNFIIKAKELGFTLKEIKDLLDLNIKSRASCRDVRVVAEAKIHEMNNKIKNLQLIIKSLKSLVQACNINSSEIKEFKVMNCFESKCKC